MKSKKLWCNTWGSPSNPTLVFIHGFMGSHLDHLPLIELLSLHFFCVAIDLPGHGNSKEMIPDCADEFDSLVLKTLFPYNHTTLIGYSMGGRIALHLFDQLKPQSLVLISSRVHPLNLKEKDDIGKRDLKISLAMKEDPFTLFLKKWYSMPMFKTLSLKLPIYKKIMDQRKHENPHILSKILLMLSPKSYSHSPSFLNNLNQPLLYLSGLEDEKYFLGMQQIHQEKKDAWLFALPNTSHALHLEDPLNSSQIIKQFHRYYHD
jgi:2-succinyl-6-hydroxy-2,4-cyclohexadiene-1-carboxylate synthase